MIEFLKDQYENGDKGAKRGALVALLKLECLDYVDEIVEIIIGDDEGVKKKKKKDPNLGRCCQCCICIG